MPQFPRWGPRSDRTVRLHNRDSTMESERRGGTTTREKVGDVDSGIERGDMIFCGGYGVWQGSGEKLVGRQDHKGMSE